MNQKSDIITAPIITYSRHRIVSDGNGVTTLVCFHNCPLRCKYCINPFSFDEKTIRRNMTPEELYLELKIDELYFLSTGGGVTFGGGEPLLYPDFIARFSEICGKDWHNNIETSLNIPWENIEKIIDSVNVFFVDCKDTDPNVYKSYTGKENKTMLDNLEKLASLISPERIVVRLPLIPNYNTEEHRNRSAELLSKFGIRHLNKFNYVIR